MVRFGIQFASEELDTKKIEQQVGEMERYGFDIIWTGDSYFSRNPYINLALMAEGTENATLGLGCTNPYTRHPVFTATAVGTINELSGNRLVLAIGAGSKDMLASVNLFWDDPVQRVRETIEIIKALMAGKKLSYSGKFYKTTDISLPKSFQNNEMPVYVACRRKKMITLAGNVADGIILDAAPLEYIPYAMERLKIGAKACGRSLKDFRFCNLIPFSVSEDREMARKSVRSFVCIDLVSVSKKTLEVTGVKRTDVDYVLEKWPDWNASAERVTEEMIDKFTLTGTKEECADKIREYVDLGVKEFLLCAPLGPTLRGTLEAARDYLIPKFKQ